MPLLSIITAAHDGRSVYFKEASESIFSQPLPARWKVEWLIQIDGTQETELNDALISLVKNDKRILISRNRAQLGPGGTRNMALARAKGDLIRVLDSDDLLLPNSLSDQVEIFNKHPDVHWATYQPLELCPDGSHKPDPARMSHGHAEAGKFNKVMAQVGRCPVHCAGLMIRADTLRAFGGWQGLPVGEDVTMLAAVSAMYSGWVMKQYGWLYRRHDGQMTNTVPDKSWRTFGEDIGAQRVKAMKKLGWVSSDQTPNGTTENEA